MSEPLPNLLVVGGLIRDGDRILLAQRAPGGSFGGCWEFPGGKVESHETDQQALARELHEELGVRVAVGALVARVQHPYPAFHIDFRVYECAVLRGTPALLGVHALQWARLGDGVDETRSLPFPPADVPVLRVLRRAAGLPEDPAASAPMPG
ncbi:MAG: (deoxy)nucleoside triphosphate pyrophosphohydrolase [Deltaproteobacteria bacterium]|nr:(deoxy)nucleoside triphosphate pyrophosphohydrolase [Deltaproteobacteria bacterium]